MATKYTKQVDIYLSSGSVITAIAEHTNASDKFIKSWKDNREDPEYIISKTSGSTWSPHVLCRAIDVIAVVVSDLTDN